MRSYASRSSNRSQLIQAKVKTASLEAKAAFLKEKQALKMAAEELELRRMIAQGKAEENVYEKFKYGECNQFEEPNSKFATSQVNYTLPPHNYIPKPTTVGNGLLDPSESTPEVKSKTIHTSPIVQSTVVNREPAESLAPETPSSPKPATTSTSKIEDPSTINPEALPFNSKQDERTGSQVSLNSNRALKPLVKILGKHCH